MQLLFDCSWLISQAATDVMPTLPSEEEISNAAIRTGEMQAARVAFNVLLAEVVGAVPKGCEHSETFRQSVQVEAVEDYLSFVDPDDATVCLDAIASRTRSCFYTSIQQFRGDFERLLANAMVRVGGGRYCTRARL